MRLVAAAVAGTTHGILAAEALFVGIAVTFAVWGLAALALGAAAPSVRSALVTGAFFGFPLTPVFSVFARTGGDTAAMATGALAAGAVGAVSCLALAAVGFYAWHRVRGRA